MHRRRALVQQSQHDLTSLAQLLAIEAPFPVPASTTTSTSTAAAATAKPSAPPALSGALQAEATRLLAYPPAQLSLLLHALAHSEAAVTVCSALCDGRLLHPAQLAFLLERLDAPAAEAEGVGAMWGTLAAVPGAPHGSRPQSMRSQASAALLLLPAPGQPQGAAASSLWGAGDVALFVSPRVDLCVRLLPLVQRGQGGGLWTLLCAVLSHEEVALLMLRAGEV